MDELAMGGTGLFHENFRRQSHLAKAAMRLARNLGILDPQRSARKMEELQPGASSEDVVV